MEKTIPLTQAFFDENAARLKYLETTGRTEVSNAIKTAKEFGDLSENAEYTAAKNAQERLEIEIAQLSEMLSKAYPIDLSLLGTKSVAVGNKVKIYDCEFDEEIEYQIVSSVEANSEKCKISDVSPLGKALMGHKVGETVVAKTPGGEIELKILNISK